MTATTLRQPKMDTVAVAGDASWTAELATADVALPALLVEGVTKRFVVGRRKRPVVAIADVSLRLERGGTVGILGANGSGKS
ncbi:MAG TPA: hypothetical protein VET90_03620, partial [Candidatus Binatus sp.]|nr:hypothetical protein [Candidatus Binatus sp.]